MVETSEELLIKGFLQFMGIENGEYDYQENVRSEETHSEQKSCVGLKTFPSQLSHSQDHSIV